MKHHRDPNNAVDAYLGNTTLCSINSCGRFRSSAIVCDVLRVLPGIRTCATQGLDNGNGATLCANRYPGELSISAQFELPRRRRVGRRPS
jgi:hypothetical protein